MPAFMRRALPNPVSGKHAAKYQPEAGYEVIPTSAARDLVAYICGLKRDYHIPAAITGAKPKEVEK
jgi:hypothetical protein